MGDNRPQPLNVTLYYMSEDIRMNLRAGMIVKVHQTITDVNSKGEEKQRVQIFEGTVLAAKHGSEPGATVTVRKVSKNIGVEKIFPIHSPSIVKIELVREMRVKQARAYYLRDFKKKLKQVRKVKGQKIIEKVENPVIAEGSNEINEVAPVPEAPVEEEKKEESPAVEVAEAKTEEATK